MAYAEQCRVVYRNLQNIDKRMGKLTIYNSNQFTCNAAPSNTNASASTNWNITLMANQSGQPAISSYAHLPSIGSTTQSRIQNDNTKLSQEELALLRKENHCFHCKEVGNHRPRCTKSWRPMSAIITALTQVYVNKVAVPVPGHVEAKEESENA